MAKNRNSNDSRFIWILIGGAASMLISPFVFTRDGFIDFSKTGPIGDTIGGLTAPIIGFMSAMLVYISFREQVKANKLLASFREEDVLRNDLNDFLKKIEVKFNNLEYQGIRLAPEKFVGGAALKKFLLDFQRIQVSVLVQNENPGILDADFSPSIPGQDPSSAITTLIRLSQKSEWLIHYFKYVNIFYSHLEGLNLEQASFADQQNLKKIATIYKEEYGTFYFTYLKEFITEFTSAFESLERSLKKHHQLEQFSLDLVAIFWLNKLLLSIYDKEHVFKQRSL